MQPKTPLITLPSKQKESDEEIYTKKIQELSIFSKNKTKIEAISDYILKNSPYTQFKFNSIIYSIGDCLMIRDEINNFSIGKLLEIIPLKGIKSIPFWPSIKVQWYYRKNEIELAKNGIDKLNYDHISDFCVFGSNHTDIILIESVICPCKILSLDEYQVNQENNEATFFFMGNYNLKTHLLNPPFSQWERLCRCNMPFNPDLLYIGCEGCKKWFHPKCEGLSEKDAETLGEFYCDKCKKDTKISAIN